MKDAQQAFLCLGVAEVAIIDRTRSFRSRRLLEGVQRKVDDEYITTWVGAASDSLTKSSFMDKGARDVRHAVPGMESVVTNDRVLDCDREILRAW